MSRHSLAFKLLVSYVLVVAIASASAFGVARWLGPRLFDHEVQQLGQRFGWSATTAAGTSGTQAGQDDGGQGRGRGPGGDSAGSPTSSVPGSSAASTVQQEAIDRELGNAFAGSLTAALLVALAVGLIAGLLSAAVLSRRILRPLRRMSRAVRRIAAGDHSERVTVPPDEELAALASDVNALGAALEETEQRRTRLVADLAHELRTPITSLDGFLEGLEDGIFEPDLETLGAMRSETRRLGRLATDLGSLSRAAEEAFVLERHRLDLGVVASDAARALAGAFASAGVDLTVSELPELLVHCDPDRMGQVFTNILRNAVQHTSQGGSVSVSGEVVDTEALVRVTDTGSGIAPQDLERVFDRFVRLGDGDPSGGAGVGLTIARGIARAHGGEILARSEGEGRGAVFEVRLPLDEDL